MAEEPGPEPSFGLQRTNEHIRHLGAAERWSDGPAIGPSTAQVAQRH